MAAENIRNLLACIAMLAVVFYAFKSVDEMGRTGLSFHTAVLMKSVCVAWGFWTGWFAVLASLQSAFIVGAAIMDVLIFIRFPAGERTRKELRKEKRSRWLDWIVTVVAVGMVVFTFGTLFIVLVSINIRR